MKSLFARLLLALIRPAIDLDRQQRRRIAVDAPVYLPVKNEALIAWADRMYRRVLVGQRLQRQENPPSTDC